MNTTDTMDQMTYDLIKVYLAQMDSSIKISEIIREHSKREELTADDIICGLIYRLMTPMSDEEIKNSLNKAEEILNNSDSEGEEEEEEEKEKEKEKKIESDNNYRKLKSNQCNCEICSSVRVCLCNYESFEPPDELAVRFKKSIQATCKKHNIYI